MTLRSSDSNPWYKERWPWLLMAGPAIVIVAGFITAWLAIVSNGVPRADLQTVDAVFGAFYANAVNHFAGDQT